MTMGSLRHPMWRPSRNSWLLWSRSSKQRSARGTFRLRLRNVSPSFVKSPNVQFDPKVNVRSPPIADISRVFLRLIRDFSGLPETQDYFATNAAFAMVWQ